MSGSTVSNSPFADQVSEHLAPAGAPRAGAADRVRNTLVAQFGTEILAAPPKHGFDLLAWVVPAAAFCSAVPRWRSGWRHGVVAVAGAARPAAAGGGPLDPRSSGASTADLAGFE